jgi:transposase
MEVITGVERRRRWRVEEKLRIVAEVEQPGASHAEIARRYDVSRGLLWHWRYQVRRGALIPDTGASFLPVHVISGPAAVEPSGGPPTAGKTKSGSDDLIEIGLADGTTIRVGSNVGAVALRRVLGALRR